MIPTKKLTLKQKLQLQVQQLKRKKILEKQQKQIEKQQKEAEAQRQKLLQAQQRQQAQIQATQMQAQMQIQAQAQMQAQIQVHAQVIQAQQMQLQAQQTQMQIQQAPPQLSVSSTRTTVPSGAATASVVPQPQGAASSSSFANKAQPPSVHKAVPSSSVVAPANNGGITKTTSSDETKDLPSQPQLQTHPLPLVQPAAPAASKHNTMVSAAATPLARMIPPQAAVATATTQEGTMMMMLPTTTTSQAMVHPSARTMEMMMTASLPPLQALPPVLAAATAPAIPVVPPIPKQSAPPPAKAAPAPVLLMDPLIDPSPFRFGYQKLDQPIEITKETPNSSFGVTLRSISQSCLVLVDPTQKRRQRIEYTVLQCIDPSLQNARSSGVQTLQPFDLILSINGVSVFGKTFQEAIQLFSKSRTASGRITATLTVARKNVVPKSMMPRTTPSYNHNLPWTPVETAALALQVLLMQQNHLLGQAMNVDFFSSFQKDYFPHRSPQQLYQIWMEQQGRIQSMLQASASQFWSQQWKRLESPAMTMQQTTVVWSDQKRAQHRALPRPRTGCKCGQLDHRYVHDPKCVLYSNIRNQIPKEQMDEILREEKDDNDSNKKVKLSKDEKAQLSKLERHQYEKLLWEKEQRSQESIEARFVTLCQDYQVHTLHQAVYAPSSLQTIVLSALFELQGELQEITLKAKAKMEAKEAEAEAQAKAKEEAAKAKAEAEAAKTNEDDEDDDDSDSDDDDDVPLAVLGKRELEQAESAKNANKRSKPNESCWNLEFLCKLVQKISHTWGHVYQEPTHRDYQWRWEVHHGYHSSSDTDSRIPSQNPRRPNSYSLEHLRFLQVSSSDELQSTVLPNLNEWMMEQQISKKNVQATTTASTEKKVTTAAAPMTASKSASAPPPPPPPAAPTAATSAAPAVPASGTAAPAPTTASAQPAAAPTTNPLPVMSPEQAQALMNLVQVVSSMSGILDELQALVTSGVVKTTKYGTIEFKEDWIEHVSPLLLQEAHDEWGIGADPNRLYHVHTELRKAIRKHWTRLEKGWYLKTDTSGSELIYNAHELEDWRRALESQTDAKIQVDEGIGMFGYSF